MSKAYVPPHKRKEAAAVSLNISDFPSLSDNVSVRAGAGGPSYVSKISSPAVTTATKEEKAQAIVSEKPFRKGFGQFKQQVVDEEAYTKTVPDESEWITKESKSSKKTKVDSDWDGFDDY